MDYELMEIYDVIIGSVVTSSVLSVFYEPEFRLFTYFHKIFSILNMLII
jgi:hypothetical protein